MALEYGLVLAGETPLADIAARGFPDDADRPIQRGAVFGIDLYDRYGFAVTLYAGRHAYCEARGDQGRWVWEPESYVGLTFRFDKDPDRYEDELRAALGIVRRVVESGPEDAAFILNDDVLVLSRFDGVLRKHNRRSWWDHYGFVDDIIPD